MICLSLEKFLISIPFHKVGKHIKDFLLWFASPKTFPKIPKTIPWPWPQLVAIYTPLISGGTNAKKIKNLVRNYEDEVSKNKVSEKDLTL